MIFQGTALVSIHKLASAQGPLSQLRVYETARARNSIHCGRRIGHGCRYVVPGGLDPVARLCNSKVANEVAVFVSD